MSKPNSIAIVGGGPAGLKAAEIAAENGATVCLFDAKPSVGRKFLVAGKSGLNLTSNDDFETFLTRYSGDKQPPHIWRSLLQDFDNHTTREWASSLNINTFVSSANKVFPEQMKAAPLLRRWIEKLKKLGVQFHMNHQLSELVPGKKQQLSFSTPDGIKTESFDKVILALGGGSWKKTGSTGSWVKLLQDLNITTVPLSAANAGWHVDWSSQLLAQAEGLPLKNIVVSSNNIAHQGELVITRYGLEGGPIYRLGPQIRKTHEIQIDFKPTFSTEQLLKKMESVKKNDLQEAKTRWKLSPAIFAILQHYHSADTLTKEQLAPLVKSCTLALTQPRPIDEAISSAGGVCWSELDDNLQLIKHPNIYLAGEMIDWEAPTGGFLLQGCLATGYRTAIAATSKSTASPFSPPA